MDLIYMNAQKEDIGAMKDYTFDLAFGSDENDFECKVLRINHCCEQNFFLYYEGTEYGGIIDDIGIDTESDEVTYYGRTWHGILNSKILEPDAGEDYLVISGEANTALGTLIARMGLSELFLTSKDASGITISNYKMNRYIAGYDGIMKMLKEFGAKLNIVFKNGFVELSAKPIVDYSKDEQFDKDQIAFAVKQKGHPVNHVICLGKGDLKEREVFHVYADKNGNISESQVFTGLSEVSVVYENTNAEDSEKLKQGGIDIIKEAWASDEVDVTFDIDDENFDIGDIVGANDTEVGVNVRREINKKIVSIKNGEATISYPSESGSTSTSSSNGGSSGGGGSDGEDGKDGKDGKSAYEYAKEGGYTGTEEEFAVKMAEEYATKDEFEKLRKNATFNLGKTINNGATLDFDVVSTSQCILYTFGSTTSGNSMFFLRKTGAGNHAFHKVYGDDSAISIAVDNTASKWSVTNASGSTVIARVVSFAADFA